jgi:diadenosine tetraphosphate (Ap4A) HIT family hydrolase
MSTTPKCSFCDAQVEDLQEITRNQTMRAVYPWRPIIPEHIMFVPLRHIKSLTELNDEEAADMVSLVRIFKSVFASYSNKTGFNVFENDGPEAGQHVPHVHVHIFGRAEDESANPYTVLNNLKNHPLDRLTDNEIRQRVEQFKEILAYIH